MKFCLKMTVVCVALLQMGCLMTRDQIRDTTSRSGEQSQVSQAQIKKAERAAKIDDLEEQVRVAVGRVEVVENEINQMKQSESAEQNPTASKLELDQRFSLFEEALKGLETQIQTLAAEVQNLKTTKSSNAAPAPRKGNFAGAEDAFNSKDWKRAIVGYQKYRDLNPKGKWYPEATYKIGVSFQELKMTTEAKAFFEEVVAKYPKGKQAQKAKYRLKNLK